MFSRLASIVGQVVIVTVAVAGGILLAKEVDKKIEEKKDS